jgi:hypothetical protein
MDKIIEPTVGRIVWFRPTTAEADPNGQPLAAIVTKVLSPREVNLAVFRGDGTAIGKSSVVLVQEGDPVAEGTEYAEWMPYQKGQAAKAEALQAKIADMNPNPAGDGQTQADQTPALAQATVQA